MKAEYITHMGSDLLVANIARISFDKESTEFTLRKDKEVGSDEGLIDFLAKHNHFTPFAHPQLTLRMKAPIPIRTQCFKSKIGFSENEESRRYISSTPELFVPDEFRSKPSGNKKQGSGNVHEDSHIWRATYINVCKQAISVYDDMIKAGVAPEQARFVLPQGCYVNWIWTGSLAAYARFCKLRQDGHAQGEIRDLSDEIIKIIEPLFPYSWKALMNS